MRKLFTFGLLGFASLAGAIEHKRERIMVQGSPLEIITSDRMELSRLRPLLVLAPARKYLMEERLFERLASAAAELGIFVVRFNWAFAATGAEPSAGLKDEAAAVEAVVRKYRDLPFVDKNKVVLAAKSFGANVLMTGPYALANAVLLITPNCDAKDRFEKRFGPLLSSKTPINITISVDDPNCDVNQLHGAVAKLDKKRLALHTLFGDHNFAVDGAFENQDAAIHSMTNWLRHAAFR